MPDITMCDGSGCPLKEKCYRHTAKPSPYRQSWFMNVPWDGERCVHYWRTEKEDVNGKEVTGKNQDSG